MVCLLRRRRSRDAADDAFLQEPLRILLPSDLGTLEALLVRPNAPGRYPLALIAHGSPRSAAQQPNMTPLAMLPQALEFARRGWGRADRDAARLQQLRRRLRQKLLALSGNSQLHSPPEQPAPAI